ncbi:MAG TPA: hypothetical protein VI504_16345, partial [Candidatus Eisenbacteria bacterium]
MPRHPLPLTAALACVFASVLAAPAAASNCAGTSTGLVPLNDLGAGFYQGVQGGLYPGGSNQRPVAHNAAGVAIANAIGPLDTLGVPDAAGKVVFVSIGFSNATQEFSAFVPKSDADSFRRANVRTIDCAEGGQTAMILAQPTSPYWDTVATRLRGHGSSPSQVQVAWLKDANANPTGGFAVNRDSLVAQFFRILQIMKQKLPNVRLCYMTSRIYAGYASTTLNPEPYAYENGFAVKQVIERQLAGDPGLNFDPASGPVVAPWVAWGPYLWADGLTPRSDGLTWACSEFSTTDGTHPSTSGRSKVADSLLAFVRADETTVPWYSVTTLAVAPPGGSPATAAGIRAWPNPARSRVTFVLPPAA